MLVRPDKNPCECGRRKAYRAVKCRICRSLQLPKSDIVTRYQRGESTPTLAKAFKTTHGTILRILRLSKIQRRSIGSGKGNLGKQFSPEIRKKMSVAQSGEKHWNWRGGISPENHLLRKGLKYKIWREKVFERDNFTCYECGARNGKGKNIYLEADHILPFAHSGYKSYRFEVWNGRTLCRECHRKISKENRLICRKCRIWIIKLPSEDNLPKEMYTSLRQALSLPA